MLLTCSKVNNLDSNRKFFYARYSLEGLLHEWTKPAVVNSQTDGRVHLTHLNLRNIEEKERELDAEIGKMLTTLFGSEFSDLGIGDNIEVSPTDVERTFIVGCLVLHFVIFRDT